ncbi:MAG: thioredoxin [Betaproteobacteria bacterium]|nr:thioredoxin [Betaproteobacteria bacterium]
MRLLLRLAALLLLFAAPHARGAELRDPVDHFFHPFLGELRAELAESRASGRKGVLVMYHFEECPACARMKKEVLNRPAVQDWFRREFVVVGIDIRGAQPVTGLDGRTMEERAYAKTVDIRGSPTFDFYAADGSRLYRHVGGVYRPDEFLALGQFVASGASGSQTFAQFRQKSVAKGK